MASWFGLFHGRHNDSLYCNRVNARMRQFCPSFKLRWNSTVKRAALAESIFQEVATVAGVPAMNNAQVIPISPRRRCLCEHRTFAAHQGPLSHTGSTIAEIGFSRSSIRTGVPAALISAAHDRSRVLLPEPESPVKAMSAPRGSSVHADTQSRLQHRILESLGGQQSLGRWYLPVGLIPESRPSGRPGSRWALQSPTDTRSPASGPRRHHAVGCLVPK